MAPQLRIRFWAESVIGGAAAVLGLLTIVWRDWIEAIFGVDPDHHSGTLEWWIVGGLLVVALVLGVVARADWRRLIALRSPGIDPVGG